jgi:tRNA(Ile)-lysidine synthase
MLQIQGKLPRDVNIACSGGVDSMAVVDFLRRNHNVNIMFFNHGTSTSEQALEFLKEYVHLKNREFNVVGNATTLTIEIGNIQRIKRKDESQEEYWRNERYRFFHERDEPVVACHHLDDCVETWIWSSLHGEGKIIPYANKNVIRPFLLNKKAEFVNWCRRNNVPWIEDASNEDTCYMRNYIRHEMLQKALVVNPGLHKVIAKKVRDQYEKVVDIVN